MVERDSTFRVEIQIYLREYPSIHFVQTFVCYLDNNKYNRIYTRHMV